MVYMNKNKSMFSASFAGFFAPSAVNNNKPQRMQRVYAENAKCFLCDILALCGWYN